MSSIFMREVPMRDRGWPAMAPGGRLLSRSQVMPG